MPFYAQRAARFPRKIAPAVGFKSPSSHFHPLGFSTLLPTVLEIVSGADTIASNPPVNNVASIPAKRGRSLPSPSRDGM